MQSILSHDDNQLPPTLPDQRQQDDSERLHQPPVVPIDKPSWPARLITIVGAMLGVLLVVVLQLILVMFLTISIVPALLLAFDIPVSGVILFPSVMLASAVPLVPVVTVLDVIVLIVIRKRLGFFAKLTLLITIAILWTIITARILTTFPMLVG